MPHLLASRNALEMPEATVCATISGDLKVSILLIRCESCTKNEYGLHL